jgi:DNA replicative helicase MCM subunit Mcm2 (Cdc46/Mcm family)
MAKKKANADDSDDDAAKAASETPESKRRLSTIIDDAKKFLTGIVEDCNIYDVTIDDNAVYVDYKLLEQSELGRKLFHELQTNYYMACRAFDVAATAIAKELKGTDFDVVVRFKNVEACRVMLNAVGARHYGKLLTTRGKVITMTPKQPYALWFSYFCNKCENSDTYVVREIGEILGKPTKCGECKSKNIEITSSKIVSSQFVKIIDSKPNKSPTYMTMFLMGDDICNKATGGQVVDVFGFYNIDFKQDAFGVSRGKPTYRLDINNIEALQTDIKDFILTPEDIKRFDRKNPDSIVNQPGFWEKSVRSFAPEIKGYSWIKIALIGLTVSMNQLESNSRKIFSTLRESTTLNILLAGHQGTAKSHFLRYVALLAPNSQYVSFASSSAASLTVGAERDNEIGMFTIKPGAGPQCDGGILAGDEFDKHKGEGVIGALHEMGSNKTVSYAIGSHVGQLPADCGWLFGCNAASGQWNPMQTLSENLDFMPPSFITRFDAIFVILDYPNEDADYEIARQTLQNNKEEYWQKYMEDDAIAPDTFGFRTMKKYVQYVNKYVPFPVVPPELEDYVAVHYSKNKRKVEELRGLITPRYVNNVIRHAVTHARWLQEPVLRQEDIDLAINEILEKSLKQIAYDPVTNTMDGNLGFGATPTRIIKKNMTQKQQFTEAFAKLVNAKSRKILTTDEIVEGLAEYSWAEQDVKKFLEANSPKFVYETSNVGLKIKGWQLT